MKICLIGNIDGNIDEGMKKVTYNTFDILSKDNDVIILNPHKIFSFNFWQQFLKFRPDIIHYLTGPSIFSFLIIKVLAFLSNQSKTIITSSHPKIKFKFLLKYLKVDSIIVHSTPSANFFKSFGYETCFIPNGVNISMFKPVDALDKIKLREKYSLTPDDYILLHVGNILVERNVKVLEQYAKKGFTVLIVGSTTIKPDENLVDELVANGCIIWTNYIEKIEEIYQLADCYIFPTIESIRAIEIPLSVLEAMACNLPVITTKFGGLPDLFENGNGFYFVDSIDEIIKYLEIIQDDEIQPDNEMKLEKLSWESIGIELNKLYNELKGE